MYYHKYCLFKASYRKAVSLTQYQSYIEDGILMEFPNAKNIVIDNDCYSYELTFKPTRGQLRKVGSNISYISSGLRQYVVRNKKGNNLFKCVERNYEFN